jgi:prepilin-type processing-associated H-X9-DG protein
LFSFHPGGINILMGDGSVRFLKDSVNVVTLRALISLNGGEVISADQY